jgi:mannobiose 2-epimerase
MATLDDLRQRLVPEFEAELSRLAAVWFPRCLDREQGGYLCDFDRRWRPSGLQHKMLEFQARQCSAAARLAAWMPARQDLRDAALHGFRYLAEKVWDQADGGWFRMLDRQGNPLEAGTKHGHGTAYAISAAVACHELSREPACLDLARAAFAWLEDHAHDREHGGYFVYYRRDGSPILAPEPAPAPGPAQDAIGTPLGCKDANTTSDLLRAFIDLYRVWPDGLLRTRIEELVLILRERLVVAPGLLHMFTQPDWSPLPDLVRYGQVLRVASHLLMASHALGRAGDAATADMATAMIDTMLQVAWDQRGGGFFYAGPGLGQTHIEGSLVVAQGKAWWVQADGIRALLQVVLERPSQAAHYASRLEDLWRYIKSQLIDTRRGGWYAAGLDRTPEARRRPKATLWKDASHETEALLHCLSLLRA